MNVCGGKVVACVGDASLREIVVIISSVVLVIPPSVLEVGFTVSLKERSFRCFSIVGRDEDCISADLILCGLETPFWCVLSKTSSWNVSFGASLQLESETAENGWFSHTRQVSVGKYR
jgi:hypothetical protein